MGRAGKDRHQIGDNTGFMILFWINVFIWVPVCLIEVFFK